MATKLGLYNDALRVIGETSLSSLNENREPRRVLDNVWNNDFVDQLLEEGQWRFASRTIELGHDANVNPQFGYTYAFSKPSDFVHAMQICSDERFNCPLLRYSDEGDYWFSDLSTIFVQYVSNSTSYGGDLSNWPKSFATYAKYALASEIVERITQNASKFEVIYKLMMKAKVYAKAKNAAREPTKFLPPGEWANSRWALRGNPGRRGQLIGRGGY